jgi:hypothetical protein
MIAVIRCFYLFRGSERREHCLRFIAYASVFVVLVFLFEAVTKTLPVALLALLFV